MFNDQRKLKIRGSVILHFGILMTSRENQELIEKLVFNVAYEQTGVAGSHFGTHGHAIDLFIIIVSE